jgi:predicted Ser/Thr protein kinase
MPSEPIDSTTRRCSACGELYTSAAGHETCSKGAPSSGPAKAYPPTLVAPSDSDVSDASTRGSPGAFDAIGTSPPGKGSTSLRTDESQLPDDVRASSRDPRNLLNQYILVKQVGKGGMGTVWRAFDRRLLRWVAIKFLLADDEESVLRFQREAQIAARLRHPNIAPIYEVAEGPDHQLFIAMEFIEGCTFEKLKAPLPEILDIFTKVCDGVESAHKGGVVHRDLKPQNVMVTAEKWPYVMDFGLAKAIAGGGSLSLSGAVMGTPSFMPPEQAEGRLELVDARSDVYSLGATLYATLTGEPPFIGQTAMEVLRKVSEEPLVPPRQRKPDLPEDVETIILKAMAKDRTDRYATAAEVAEDIRRFLKGDEIVARAPSSMALFARRMRRRLVPLLLIALLVMGGAAIAYVAARRGPGRQQEQWLRQWMPLRAAAVYDDWRAGADPAPANAHLRRLPGIVSLAETDRVASWFERELERARADAARPDRVAAWCAYVEACVEGVEPLRSAHQSALRLRTSAEWTVVWIAKRGALAHDGFASGPAADPAAAHLRRMGEEHAAAAVAWLGAELDRAEAALAAARAEGVAGREKAARTASWAEAVRRASDGLDGLGGVRDRAERLRAEAAVVASFRGTFTLKVSVAPFGEVTRVTRDGKPVDLAHRHTPFSAGGLEIGEYEVELSIGGATSVVKIPADALHDGRTVLIHGRAGSVAWRELPQ